MQTTTLKVTVPLELEQRAQKMAAASGESLAELVQAALEEYLEERCEEQHDVALARSVNRRIETGEETLHSKEAVWAELDELSD